LVEDPMDANRPPRARLRCNIRHHGRAKMMKFESDPNTAIIAAAAIVLAGCSADEIVRRGPIMTITPTRVEIAVGDTTRFRAAFYLQSGGTVTWTSSAPEIATVDGSGLVRATGAGQTTVSAYVKTPSGEFRSTGVVNVHADP
jgi:hypothetical protein